MLIMFNSVTRIAICPSVMTNTHRSPLAFSRPWLSPSGSRIPSAFWRFPLSCCHLRLLLFVRRGKKMARVTVHTAANKTGRH